MRGQEERYTTLEKTKQIQIQGLENRKTIKKKDQKETKKDVQRRTSKKG